MLASVCLGRLFSLLVNFTLVKHFVFRSQRRGRRQFLLYLLQVALMAFVAAQLVEALGSVAGIAPSVSKLPVDVLLYPLNFVIQKWVIFRTPTNRSWGTGRRESPRAMKRGFLPPSLRRKPEPKGFRG